MKPLVSVLMTVYNREKYIAEAIESILASTYQNWELIIVDDQSKDKSIEIAKRYEAKDKRIRVYLNEKNLGDYPNRNKAASYANGKYLKYVDADDLIYPYGIEQLIFYMEQFPEVGYGLCSLDQDKEKKFPFELSSYEAFKRHYIENKWLFHKAPLSSIIKRDAFIAVGGFSGKQHLGDFELWQLLSAKFSVVCMPHGIVWYREHPDQQMNDNRRDPFVPFKYLLLSQKLIGDQLCPLNEEEKKHVLKKIDREIARYTLRTIKSHSLKKAYELKKASNMSFSQIIIKSFIYS